MAMSDQFGRPMRLGVAPFTTVIIFALLLGWFFILYQPSTGPGMLQGIGRQAWEIVSQGSFSSHDTDDFGLPLESTPKPTDPASTNWWEKPVPSKPVDQTGLPLGEWNPLLPHQAGLSEITVARCMFPPSLVYFCTPPQKWDEQWRNGGSWVRVDRDINAQAGFWYLNLYYRRTRRSDVPLITNITALALGEESQLDDIKSWVKVATSLRDGVPGQPPLYLWYKVGPKLQDYHEPNSGSHLITELDVSYGDSPAWYGFEKLPTPVTQRKDGSDASWITFRRGIPKDVPAPPPLHFSPDKNGTYKIMQVADLHFSTGPGSCRDTTVSPCPNADAMSSKLLSDALDAEKPDLVVFTGDQLNGQKSTWDAKSVLTKFAKEVIRRRIPWAAVLGNHDDEDDLNRKQLMEHISQMPYSVAAVGPSDVDGAGNYVLKIRSPDASATHILTLYFLDSHGYLTTDYGVFKKITDYDYIRARQTQWYIAESEKVEPIMRPFDPKLLPQVKHVQTPAGGGVDVVARAAAPAKKPQPAPPAPPARRSAKPNALMFFHIPLPETFSPADVGADGAPLEMGSMFDTASNSKKNDGFFAQGILLGKEGRTADTRAPEVKVVGNGHMHTTDTCRRVKGVWICFGGGGSYSGYGRLGWDRRFRIYQIEDWGETIRTYKRTEFGEIIDNATLVGRGALK